MRKMKKTLTALLLIFAMLITFCSCGRGGDYIYKNNSSDYVYKYGDYAIDKSFYSYWIARYKAVLMYSYYDIEDTDSFWDTDYGNGTANEVLTAYADETIKNYLMSVYLFDKFDLQMAESVESGVDSQLKEIVDDAYEGNVALLNEDGYEYGINYNMLRQIYLAEAKTELVYDHLTSNVLKDKLTDEARETYLKDNYAHTTHIFIATEYNYNIDDDGNVIYDDEGNYTTELTEEQKKEKETVIAEIDSLTLTAENFGEYQKKYNEDIAIDKYANGYFVSSNIDFDTAYITAALTMDPGEVQKVEGTNGIYYILKQEMQEKAYEDERNADFFESYDEMVLNYLYWEYMDDLYADITVNDEIKKNISIKTVSPCWYF